MRVITEAEQTAGGGSVGEPARRRFLPRLGAVQLVGLCVLFTLALRIPFLTWPLMPDEAGMLIVARHWSDGPFLYGDYFVGRGIVVALFYVLGNVLGGAIGVRLLACLVAATMVVAAGWAGYQLRGRAGAGWAALVAAAYSSTYAFSSETMNERLLAAVIVMLGCAVTLSAVAHPTSWPRATLAGVLVSTPLLVVQSYADGLVFAGVVVVVSVLGRTLAVRDAVRIALGGLLGILLTAGAVVLALALTPMTASQFWFQMFGYRMQASSAIKVGTDMPAERLHLLMWVSGLTGVLLLLLCLFGGAWKALKRPDLRPVWFGLLGMLGVAGFGMMAGGDYWSDYLLQPVPALAMAAAVVAPFRSVSGYAMRLGAVAAAVASMVAIHFGLSDPRLGTPTNEAAVGKWVGAAAEPGDTGFVLWGKANVLYGAGLTSPYPFLWSLLTRTLDPHLHELVTTIKSPDAPTWIIEWLPPDTWGLDSKGRLAHLLGSRYRLVGTPCGRDVYLLRGVSREVPTVSQCGHLP